ncbi:hypothetical protein M0G43_10005 [Subsaxibacter sp. CAU 1640]|uniref:hypothetical protein n=1 Tax=Subsaxibacter sp. CAU 1640 TaxID=2933271 RepID=UPI002005EA51|nr:hypothetical protein [Subsaxibacter sp. CAU 1640]MCK7590904.1 hypothetical protein [Subsaxibacter sp. CAU 1640]
MEKKSIIQKTSKTVTDSSEQLLAQLKNGLFKIGDIGTGTKNKFVNYVKEVFDVLPLIEKAGFRTNRLIVSVSVPPSIEIHFSRFKELSPKETEQILTQYSDRKMFKLIFKANCPPKIWSLAKPVSKSQSRRKLALNTSTKTSQNSPK